MRKILIGLFTLIILIGCRNSDMINNNRNNEINKEIEEKFIYIDGEYAEIVNGYGGEFVLTVVIEEGKIVNVVIGENNETPSIGGMVAEQLADNIKLNQFKDIDLISGATITSNGVKEAFDRIKEKALSK
jgi:Uncharacterized protein conserved in bacteria